MPPPFPELALPADLGARATNRNGRRQEMRQEALRWAKGPDPDHPHYTPVYRVGTLEVRAGRPGKEARRKKPNLEDTFPALFDGRRDLGFYPSLETYADGLYELAIGDRRVGELVGALLYRSIHLLDHHPDPAGHLRWTPSARVIREISDRTPKIDVKVIGGIRALEVEAYLDTLEVILVNEDLKFGRVKVDDSGRPNTLATMLSVLAVGSGARSVPSLAYSLALGRGVVRLSRFTRSDAISLFPDLA